MFYSALHTGSLVLDVSGNRLDAKMIRTSGVIDDYFTILKKLPAPTSLSAAAGDGSVTLSWSAVETATGYSLKRATTNVGPYQTIASGLMQTLYTDPALTNGQTYFYVVSATNSLGESADSTALSATPMPPPAPAAPTDLVATVSTTTSITLAWTDASTNESGFRIEGSSDGVTFTQNASVGADVTTFTSLGLRASRTYYFRVRAYHDFGTSAYSNVLIATTAAP